MDLALSNLACEFTSILSFYSSNSNLTPLSFASRARVQFTFDHAWADSTLSKYRGVVAQFQSFCDAENIPRNLRLPASEDLLCGFTASWVCSIAGTTVKSQLAALKAWHVYNNAPWLGGARLRYVLHGVENLTPLPSRRPPRPPITRNMLCLLASNLSRTDPLDVCCLAAATCAMWGQLRLGEILSQWEFSFVASKVSCRHHLQPPLNTNGSRILHLPFTKVTKSKGDDVCICCQSDGSDPIAALTSHLHVNNPPPNVPLFSFCSPNGWRCLTKKKLLLRCNAIWLHFGIPSSTGHSFRIGGTTELLLSGVPPDVVKSLGRWSSDAFLRYWRSLELLAPLHVENISTSAAPSSLHF